MKRSKLSLYAQLARPFTLLPPLLGIVSGAICAFGSVHHPDPSRSVTSSVVHHRKGSVPRPCRGCIWRAAKSEISTSDVEEHMIRVGRVRLAILLEPAEPCLLVRADRGDVGLRRGPSGRRHEKKPLCGYDLMTSDRARRSCVSSAAQAVLRQRGSTVFRSRRPNDRAISPLTYDQPRQAVILRVSFSAG